LQIRVNYDQAQSSLPSGFVAAVNYVVNYFDALFTNSVTITINVGYGEINGQALAPNALGESEAAQYVSESYASVRSALLGQSAPGSSSLPLASPFRGSLDVSQADAKALGLYANDGSIDGYIGFDAAPNTFSYAPNVTPSDGLYYFVGVVEHEFSEIMGRMSLLGFQPTDYALMDLFRYSGSGARDLTTGGSGSTAYFSIDNGATNLGTWNNDPASGDLGDWYPSGPASGGFDAYNDYSNSGVINAVSANDVTLLNALGWSSTPPDNDRDTLSDTSLPLLSLTVGSSTVGWLTTAGDQDIYAITLAAGTIYTFDLEGSNTPGLTLVDPYLRLLDSSGNQLVANDDISASNWSSDANFVATTSGTYYLEALFSPSDPRSQDTGSYSISATQVGVVPADNDRDSYNDTSLPLLTLAVGASTTGSLTTAGDKDIYAITLTAGTIYTFDLKGSNTPGLTLIDPYLRLLDSSGNQLAVNDDISASNWSSEIANYVATTSGTYYLEASFSPNDPRTQNTGTYSISATQVGVVPADNDRDTYNDPNLPLLTLAVGGSTIGSLTTPGDKDIYAITLTAGATYTFDLEGSNTPGLTLIDPYLRLLDSSGNQVAANDDISASNWSSEIANYVATTSGTYYLEASFSPNDPRSQNTGTYNISATQVRVAPGDNDRDTYNDTSLPLLSLTVGGSTMGSLTTAGDKDIYAITLAAGTTYTFDLKGSNTPGLTLIDPYLGLLDSSGNQLAVNDDISASNWSSEIAKYTATTSGTYYLEASFSPSDARTQNTGTYSFSATQVGTSLDTRLSQFVQATAGFSQTNAVLESSTIGNLSGGGPAETAFLTAIHNPG
jgi:hypothetical protein